MEARKQDGAQMRVKVHCRLRPGSSAEAEAFVRSQTVESGDVVTLNGDESWQYDSFLDEGTDQGLVYQKVAEPIVSSVLKGYNGTVMAYGQTGSGKTHTMFGTAEQPGIIPHSLGQIFSVADGDNSNAEFTVSVSYVQIYCELLTDLLCPEEGDLLQRATHGGKPVSSLHIREDPKKGVFIENLSSVTVSSAEEAMALISEGDENRVRAATNMNDSSSRSHACVIVNIKKRLKAKKRVKYGKLILVDLAGSERVRKSLGEHVHSGVRFTEARAINVSLSALGNCISALARKKSHIPFRDAKLTRLLKDSLGGNSMTALVINIAKDPGSYSETKSTLSFGARAMAVTNTHVRVNEEVDFEQLYSNLQGSLDSREDQIAELEIALQKKEIELAEARKAAGQAHTDKQMLEMQLGTISVPGEARDQIAKLQDEHRAALKQVEERFETAIGEERGKAAAAQEEWYRIEYELKAEREEHLRTCALLREKQEQLADMERSHEERLAELLEDLRAANEKSESLGQNLKNAFDERKLLLARNDKLRAQLEESKAFQDRGLQLMNKLTSRVETLEKRRHHEPGPGAALVRREAAGAASADRTDHDEYERHAAQASGGASTYNKVVERPSATGARESAASNARAKTFLRAHRVAMPPTTTSRKPAVSALSSVGGSHGGSATASILRF